MRGDRGAHAEEGGAHAVAGRVLVHVQALVPAVVRDLDAPRLKTENAVTIIRREKKSKIFRSEAIRVSGAKVRMTVRRVHPIPINNRLQNRIRVRSTRISVQMNHQQRIIISQTNKISSVIILVVKHRDAVFPNGSKIKHSTLEHIC